MIAAGASGSPLRRRHVVVAASAVLLRRRASVVLLRRRSAIATAEIRLSIRRAMCPLLRRRRPAHGPRMRESVPRRDGRQRAGQAGHVRRPELAEGALAGILHHATAATIRVEGRTAIHGRTAAATAMRRGAGAGSVAALAARGSVALRRGTSRPAASRASIRQAQVGARGHRSVADDFVHKGAVLGVHLACGLFGRALEPLRTVLARVQLAAADVAANVGRLPVLIALRTFELTVTG